MTFWFFPFSSQLESVSSHPPSVLPKNRMVASATRAGEARESHIIRQQRPQEKMVKILVLNRTRVVKDVCTGKRHRCDPQLVGNVGYAFFISNSSGYAVPRRGRDEDDRLTYFDYLYTIVSRLSEVTRFPIIILVSKDVSTEHRNSWRSISPSQVEIREVIPMYEAYSGAETDRPYHLFSFGKFELFNPRWIGDFTKLISMDLDTFVLKNVDEAFCIPGEFAAVRRRHDISSGFNAGFLVIRPSKTSYNGLVDLFKRNCDLHKRGIANPNHFGEQPLLVKFFTVMACLDVVYNCGGFSGANLESLKCDLRVSDDAEIWKTRSVVHAKLSQRKIFTTMPSISAEWRKHLPVTVLQTEGERVHERI